MQHMRSEVKRPSLNAARLAQKFRDNRGLQLLISQETGLSQGWLSKIARGMGIPNLSAARKLESYGLPLSDWEILADTSCTGDRPESALCQLESGSPCEN